MTAGALPGSPGLRVAAIVPARNEAARIARTLEELRPLVDEIVVVDDASTDSTAALAARAGATVIRNSRRLGYVGSIRRGFRAADCDIVVTVDADGEMPLELLRAIVAPIEAGAADMVQGHRDHVARASERLVTAAAGLGGPVGDSGTGFRAIRRDLAAGLEIRGTCICGSLALEALARGARIAEIPIHPRRMPGRRRIAWSHARQLVTVVRLVLRLQVRRARAARRRRASRRRSRR